MDHRDTGIDGIARRVEFDRLSEQGDLTLVRPVEAGEDVREGRLAGAVLAEQRVNLAGGGLEVDVLVRDDRRESLCDAPERDRWRWRGGVNLPAGTVSPWRYRSRL
jgi:hypothetical protein